MVVRSRQHPQSRGCLQTLAAVSPASKKCLGAAYAAKRTTGPPGTWSAISAYIPWLRSRATWSKTVARLHPGHAGQLRERRTPRDATQPIDHARHAHLPIHCLRGVRPAQVARKLKHPRLQVREPRWPRPTLDAGPGAVRRLNL